MALKLRTQFFSAEIIDIEGIACDSENTGLGTLYRKARIDEKDCVLSLLQMRTEQECGEAALHRSHCRHTAQRVDINVQIGLQKAGGLLFEFWNAIDVWVLRGHAGVKRLLFGLYAHTHGRKTRYTHFKMKEFCAALLFESLCNCTRLTDSRTRDVENIHLLQ